MNANDFGDPLDAKLQEAVEFLNAGQKKEARKVLREALNIDRNNLATWELLLRATYNVKEELHCLKRILAIDPNHESAKRRFAAIKSSSLKSPKRTSSRRKRQEALLLLLFLGSLVSIVCVGIAGFALMRGGYIPFSFSGLTATAVSQKNASCEVLIQRAIQASGDYCGNTGSNNACYGNTTIKADLANDSTRRFSERGDIVAVKELSRLTASPLNLDTKEWGIAVFKLIANLPRSLPGETVTMVVFGNATLDNDSGDSDSLESFYFSSELGQIVCEKVPFDGLIINSPDGSGIRFKVNNTELVLMGSAGIKAVRNGEMEISIYKGSARVVSNGEEQYVGAGQKTSVRLGGENGNQSISPPSEPEPLSQDELAISCTMTGQFCSQDEIIPLSEEQAQSQIESGITSTPTLTLTPSLTYTPSSTVPATSTLLVLPSATYSPGPTSTRTATRTRGPTETPGPTRTFTNTVPPTRTNTPVATPTRTNTPITPTLTFTNTPVTPTLTFTNTPVTPTLTFTNTPVTPTPIPAACTDVSLGALTNLNPKELEMIITNTSGGAITITELFVDWVKSAPSQKLDQIFLNGVSIWQTSDTTPPSNIPAEGAWKGSVADRTIPNGAVIPFMIQFQDDLEPNGYQVKITFDIGCYVSGTK